MRDFKAAVIQAAPVYLNLDASIDKAISLIAEAAGNGAELVAFPETWLPGYPWFVWLDAPAWGLQFIPRYHDNSMAVDSPQMQRLCDAARQHSINVVMGFSERAHGSRYMAQAIIGADGELLLTRRKLKPTHVERTVFGDGDGSHIQVIETSLGRVGALNCWEHLQPLVKMAMFSMHEEIHVAGWPSFCVYRDMAYALGPEVNLGASRQYAVEGGCFVLAATATVSQEMFDTLCDTPEKAKLLNPRTEGPGGGASMIFAPDGRELCEALPEDQEGILYADLTADMISIAKAAADPVGHYSRPDVLSLVIDRRPRRVMQDSPAVAASSRDDATISVDGESEAATPADTD